MEVGLVAGRGTAAPRSRPRRNRARRRIPAAPRRCACAPAETAAGRRGRAGPRRARHGRSFHRPALSALGSRENRWRMGARSVWCGPTLGPPRHRRAAAAQSRKVHRESHRQLAPQGQYRRTRRQALRRPQRRKLPPRQGHPDHPDRHAPDQRRRKGGAALQDHRAGRTRLCGGPRAPVPLSGRRRLPFHEYGELRPGHVAGRHHRRPGRLSRSPR